jgi:hypothetical protein
VLGYEISEVDLSKASELTFTKQDTEILPYSDERKISLRDLINGSASNKETFAATYQRALRFKVLGYEISEVDLSKASELTFTKQDIEILPYDDRREIEIRKVLEASLKLKLSVGAVLERVTLLKAVSYKTPDLDAGLFRQFRITKEELSALPRDEDLLNNLLKTAAELREPVIRTFTRLLLMTERHANISGAEIAAGKYRYHSGSAFTDADWLQTLNIRLMIAAFVQRESVGKTLQGIKHFTPSGIRLPYAPDELEDLLVETKDFALLAGRQYLIDAQNLKVLSGNGGLIDRFLSWVRGGTPQSSEDKLLQGLRKFLSSWRTEGEGKSEIDLFRIVKYLEKQQFCFDITDPDGQVELLAKELGESVQTVTSKLRNFQRLGRRQDK